MCGVKYIVFRITMLFTTFLPNPCPSHVGRLLSDLLSSATSSPPGTQVTLSLRSQKASGPRRHWLLSHSGESSGVLYLLSRVFTLLSRALYLLSRVFTLSSGESEKTFCYFPVDARSKQFRFFSGDCPCHSK